MEMRNRILVVIFLVVGILGVIFFTGDDITPQREPIFDIIDKNKNLEKEVDTLKIEIDSLENQIDTLNLELDKIRAHNI